MKLATHFAIALCIAVSTPSAQAIDLTWTLRLGAARIEFEVDLPAAARGTVMLVDVLGRKVRTLVDGQLPAGRTALQWDGRGATGARLASGIYFATLVLQNQRRTVRVPFVR